jgi:deoxyadenosine/deoxycytidine kinase
MKPAADRPFFLAIAGNIGVGKSHLTSGLAEMLGWEAYYEPVIHNPYLEDFYADMRRWAFHLQIYFLSERFKAQKRMSAGTRSFIQDRTIYEDAEVFARVLHEQGDMTRVDFENYKALFDQIVDLLRPPDLVLYLKARPETLVGRIRARGRECESTIAAEYLARLEGAYGRWMERPGRFAVRVIDTETVDFVNDRGALEKLAAELKEMERLA